jgi:hypothetical protein
MVSLDLGWHAGKCLAEGTIKCLEVWFDHNFASFPGNIPSIEDNLSLQSDSKVGD